MNFNNSRLVDHKQMKFGTFVPYMYRFVIIVKYLKPFKPNWTNIGPHWNSCRVGNGPIKSLEC